MIKASRWLAGADLMICPAASVELLLLLGHKRTRWDPSAGPAAVINDAWLDLVRRPWKRNEIG